MRTVLMQRPRSKQRGSSFFSWVGIIFIVAFVAQLLIKLSPAYLESYAIKDILKSLSYEPELSNMSPSEVRNRLSKSFQVNSIEGDSANSLKVRRIDDKIVIDMAYEKRMGFIANIDLILSFDYHLDSSNPSECCRRE